MTPERLHNWISAAGGRRFLLTLGCGIVDAVLLWFGKLSSSDFVMLTMGTVAVYIGGSTYHKVKGGIPDEKPA